MKIGSINGEKSLSVWISLVDHSLYTYLGSSNSHKQVLVIQLYSKAN